ncbi:aspartyl protease family protein [Chryseobacterium kwangjuense]|uniref:PDZ domain-containing protein n=1 Tax=Chryseobacterium kwangjuense TaxID=267125 RepID=A0A135WEB9_9FLAO|nr:aspartyl protease family protein [Chryseobacterium kwangjuense]KXH83256.1 hypothetical protein AU378_12635 [Chryseobacterium kwangjuense]
MKSVIRKTGLLFTFLCAIGLYAQQIKLPCEFSKDKKSIFIKLPMENQKDSLLFFFDTGAGTTMLDKKVAEKYGLKSNYRTEVSGAGGKKLYEVLIKQKIFLDKNNFISGANIVLDDLSRLNSLYEKKFDGIIGAAILNNYLTKIDFETRTMNLYNFEDSLDYAGYEKIGFEFFSGIPKFPISFELKNGEKFSGDILFDSGAGLSILVNTPYKEKNGLLDKMGKTINYSSSNLSNKTRYDRGLIKSIRLGNTTIKNKNITISLASDKQGVSSSEDLLGILGSEIINRFNFILDYKNKNLYLRPNHLFDDDFDKLVSPLALKYSEDRSEIIISNVKENTNASKKGLKEGQKIISINDIVSKDIYVYEQLLKQENKKVIIKYLDNNNEIKTVKFKLKKLL